MAAIIPVLFAACTPTPPALVREATTVQVPVPVRERCIAAEDIPAIPQTHIPRSGDLVQRAAGAAADIHELAAYAETADRLLRLCAQPKETP